MGWSEAKTRNLLYRGLADLRERLDGDGHHMRNHGVTDTRLRELYQHALAQRSERKRERCIAPEAILALLRREGPDEQRLEVLDHVMGCGACRGEMELLRSIELAGAETTRTEVAHLRPRRGWRQFAPLALAASVLLAVVVGQKFRRPEGPDIMRGGADAVTLLAPPSEVAAGAPLTFAWRPVPGAGRYKLEVLDEQGTVVFAQATDQTSVTLPDARRLVPGSEYRWWVRAITDADAYRASRLRGLRTRRE